MPSTDIKDYYRRSWGLGDRVGFQGGQLVQPGALGVRQGYGGQASGEATALSFYKKDVAKFGEDTLNEAAQILEGKNYSELTDANTRAKIKKELKEFGSVLGPEDSKKRSRKIRAKREAKIKINLIEATQEGYFEPTEFIEKNNITLKQLEKEAKQLQRNIYEKRGILTGKKSKSTLEWLTSNDFKLDNTLSKLSKSKLIVFKRDRIGDILYDAFGREFEKGSTTKRNPTRDVEKYNIIKKNLNEFETLKRAIAEKYPNLKFQLDHPLSKQTIRALMTGTAEELSRVNVLDAELNQGFKKALSEKYLNSLTAKNGKVDLEAKRAVEKIAKDLKLNIGNISDDVKRFEQGVDTLEKLNVRDEIIKSLKNQKNLSTGFKSYLKNNPELFKIAGFKDTSKLGTKLTQVTDNQIKEIIKIIGREETNKLSATIQSIMRKKNSGLNVVDIARWGSAELSALDDIAGKLPSKALSAFGKLLKAAGIAAIPLDVLPFTEAHSKGLGTDVGAMNLAEIYTNLPGTIWEAGEWVVSKAKGKKHEWKPPYEATFGREYETKKMRETSLEDLEKNVDRFATDMVPEEDLEQVSSYLDRRGIPGITDENVQLQQYEAELLERMRKEKALADQKKKEESLTGVDKYILSNLDV